MARALADELSLPLVEKDTFKEIVGEALGIVERADSVRLGGAIFDLVAHVVHELLRRGVSVLVEGNFAASSRVIHDLPPCRAVQVHVDADPDVLRDRLRSRDRHGVHYDRDAADEIAERAGRGEWAALDLPGELISIDTTGGFPDAASIVSRSVFA